MKFEDMDCHITVCLEQGDKKRKDILIFLRKYEDLTDSQLHRSLDRLRKKGLVEPKRYGIYGLTKQGKREQTNLSEPIVEEPKLTPLTNCLAFEHQRAAYRLGLDAVISKYLLKEDEENWIAIVLAGNTKDEKSINARLVAWTFGFDHRKVSYSLHYAAPGDFGVRRYPEGKGEFGVRISPALSRPLLILEELDKVKNRETEANVKYLLQGERKVNVDEHEVTVDTVPLFLFNLQKGEGPEHIEKRLGREYIRRAVVLNTKWLKLDYEKIEQLGRKAVKRKEGGHLPKIDLSRLNLKKKNLTESEIALLRKLLHRWVKKEEKDIIDTERVSHLVLGRLARSKDLSVKQAICAVAYDYLLTRETIGVMKEGWKEAFCKQVQQFSKLEKNQIQAPPLAPEKIEVEKRTKKFQATDKKDPETVKEKIKFQEEYRDELKKLEKWETEIEEIKKSLDDGNFSWEKIDQVLVEQGHEVPSPERCEKALQLVNKEYKRIQDWDSLKKLKETNDWLNDTYIKLLREAKQRIKIYKKVWDQIWDWISNAKKISQIPPIRTTIDKSPLAPSQKHRLKEAIDQKEATLEKEKQSKIEELVSYLRKMRELGDSFDYEKMKKLARDITEDLVQLELIKRENDHFRGKNGEIYKLDTFNLPKWTGPFVSIDWDPACCQALTLLTGIKHKTLAERMGNFSFSSSRKEREKEKMPAWEKWAWGLGIGSVIGGIVYSVAKNRKPKSYIQTPEGLIPVSFLREEGDWLVLQSTDGQTWKLPYNTTRISVLLKPEHGGHTYWFIGEEKENLIVQGDQNEEKIPINQVDKIIYKEESKSEVNLEPKTTVHYQKYYKERPVQIIGQTEYGYIVRDAEGNDESVLKNEVIFKNKES